VRRDAALRWRKDVELVQLVRDAFREISASNARYARGSRATGGQSPPAASFSATLPRF
jgi:hypothetical protein